MGWKRVKGKQEIVKDKQMNMYGKTIAQSEQQCCIKKQTFRHVWSCLWNLDILKKHNATNQRLLTFWISHVLYGVPGYGILSMPVAMSTTISSRCMGMGGPPRSCRARTMTVVLSARSMRSFQNSRAVHPSLLAQDIPFGPFEKDKWSSWNF